MNIEKEGGGIIQVKNNINFIAIDIWDYKSIFLRISLLPHSPAKLDFMIIKPRFRLYHHVIVIHM